jgi:polysaccharide biosynthesis transport protein
MTLDSSLATSRAGGELVETIQAPIAPKQANPLLMAHSLLRGRYTLAICLALLGAAVGAPLGYLQPSLEYKSVGVIRMHPIIPIEIYKTEDNGPMPMFDSFLSSQAAQIRSRRIMGEAMIAPEWKAFGRGLLPKAVAQFEKSLKADIPKSSQLIQVSFTDPDPKAAAAAVKSVIQTYEKVFENSEAGTNRPKIERLEARKRDLSLQLTGINDRILKIANDFGSASLQDVYNFKVSELQRVESQLTSLRMQKLMAGIGDPPSTAPSTRPANLPPEFFATRDPWLQELHRRQREEELNLKIVAARYGESHPKMIDAKSSLRAIEQQIKGRTEQLQNENHIDPAAVVAANGDGNKLTHEQLRATEGAWRSLHESLQAETMTLGRKNIEIEKLRADAAQVGEQLADVSQRLVELNVENVVSGRVSVISYGEVPIAPENDRRGALACVGGIGLAGFGVGIVILIGFLDRRMHHIGTAQSRLKPAERLLGVLPQLANDGADPILAADTAHCVHRIRAMLQIRQRTSGHKTCAITSPGPGDGKTSLTITLGMSLASSGCRTLLVDCDMDSGGLSTKLGRAARRPLGQILLDAGLLGEANLQDAVEFARENRMRLGAAVVRFGHATQAQIDQALRDQRAAAPGLGEVLGGEPYEKAVHPTAYPLLSVLPLGVPAGAHAGKLAPESMRRLLDRLAQHFDVVLIDCGPILGSVEASIVAAEADDVILLVSRGGDRKAAENAVNLLTAAGANIEGVVFNRADPDDVTLSGFSSASSRRGIRSGEAHTSEATIKSSTVP